MPGESTVELQTLYFEIGDAWARENKLAPAADAYALAHYYAKRSQNRPLADLCREQMLLCQAGHPVAKDDCSPLYFAQLLMRYPVDEVTRILNEHKSRQASVKSVSPVSVPTPVVPVAHSAPSTATVSPQDWKLSPDVMASSEPFPMRHAAAPVRPVPQTPSPSTMPPANPVSSQEGGIGVLDYPSAPPLSMSSAGSGLASLFGTPNSIPAYPGVSLPPVEPYGAGVQPSGYNLGHTGFEHHHASPFGAAPAYASRAASDFEFSHHPNVGGRTYSPRSSYPEPVNHSWLSHLAGMVATAGVMVLGFLSYQAWPDLQKIDLNKAPMVVEQAMIDARTWYEQHEHLWRHSKGVDSTVPGEKPSATDADSIGEPVSVSNEHGSMNVRPVSMESKEVVPPAPTFDQPSPESLSAIPGSSTELAVPPRPMNWTSSKMPAAPLPPLGK